MSEKVALITQGLTKSYGRVRALRGIDLEVRRGEIFGFLGPNGAGKTTTIRCLLDLIHPDSGTVRVLGINPQADPLAVRARTGYLPGELALDDELTGEQQLRYLNDLRGKKADWGFVQQLAQRLEVDLKRPIKNLSHGNKQKVAVVQALMHRPELLLLDEPTLGLDPLMQREVLRLLAEAKADGATVFLASHILSEVQATAERVAFIREGVIVEVAETAALINRALRRATIRFKQAVDVSPLADVPGVTVLSQDDARSAVLQIQGEMDALIKALAAFPVSDFETERPSLEEIFLTYYEGDRRKSPKRSGVGRPKAQSCHLLGREVPEAKRSGATGRRHKVTTIFRYTLRRLRGQILGWGLALSLLVVMIVGIYDSIAGQQEQLAQLVASYPPELMAFFGVTDLATVMLTAEGFVSMEFFSLMPLILGIFAVWTGSGLLASDEEKGTLDLIMAHPVSRSALFTGRLLAFVTATLGTLAILWLAFIVSMHWSTMNIGAAKLARPFLSLLAVLLLFGALALLLSMLLPSRRLAASVSGLLLVVSYFVTSLARINEDLEAIAKFSPLNYYQTEEAFKHFSVQWFAGLLLAAVIFAVLAWRRFLRRDIRVGGEGGWRLPVLLLPFRRASR